MPISGAYVADLAPTHQRGLYMGAYGMVWAVAFVFGPSLGMLLFSINHILLWSVCGGLGLLAAGTILAEPRGEPRIPIAPPAPGRLGLAAPGDGRTPR